MGLTRIRAQQISNIDYKQAVRVVTTSGVTLDGGAPRVVDGVTLMANDRVLVAGQAAGSENGLYRVQTVGAGENGTWVRTSDANETGEIEPGMVVMVTEGGVYADTPWKLTTNGEIIIGTTALTFSQFASGSGTPGGSNTQIQYNSANTFAGSSSLTWNGSELFVNGTANVTGNVTGNYFIGNGSALTGIQAGGTTTVSNTAPVGPEQGDVWIVGNTGVQLIYFTSGGNSQWAEMEATTSIEIQDYGNTQVVANLAALSSNPISTTGNVTAGYFIGNGSQLTGLPASYGNANVVANLAALSSNPISTTGNVTAGNMLTAGVISATGNITGNYILGNGSQLTGITGGSSATNGIFVNTSNVSANYTIAAGTNGMSVGPITVDTEIVATVADGQRWVIL